MSLISQIVSCLRTNDEQILQEIRNVMNKVEELQLAVNEMRQAVADEATQLLEMFGNLQEQIDARVDPSSLQPMIEQIRSSITNINALSDVSVEEVEDIPPILEEGNEEEMPPQELDGK